ncbi:MAG: MFS transporter [Microbacterium sp.]|uniref:MFS transporter n=1 Tax=Microbacterium sp. TaxID=51671 RepID=UPI001D2CC8FF|nr:MFS transporter [Microbacterium sp.]MBW8762056.1 MFS transporter [Microbacterium sp.]
MTSTARRRSLAFLALSATQLMVILDGTVVTVALPAIRSGLGFSFLTGVALFTAASILCGLAWDPASLLIGRALQGVGGGLSTAVSLGMIADLFPEPAPRMRAFAVLAFIGSAGGAIGMVAGGMITEFATWPWVFLVNAPIGVAALALGAATMERVPGHPVSGGLVPRDLFSARRFTLAGGVLFTMVIAGMSFQFLSSLFLQDALGLSPLATGAAFLAVTVPIAITSLGLSVRLAARFGSERVLIAALAFFAAGMVLMARVPHDGSFWMDVAPAFVVMGAGFGLAMPQATDLAMSAAPPEHAGAASAFLAATQQAGGAIGVFAVASLAAATDLGIGYLLGAGGLLVGIGLAVSLGRATSGGPDRETVDDAVSGSR